MHTCYCKRNQIQDRCLVSQCMQTDWRLEQVQQLIKDSNLHCQTLAKTLIKSKHDMDKAQSNLKALQGK